MSADRHEQVLIIAVVGNAGLLTRHLNLSVLPCKATLSDLSHIHLLGMLLPHQYSLAGLKNNKSFSTK